MYPLCSKTSEKCIPCVQQPPKNVSPVFSNLGKWIPCVQQSRKNVSPVFNNLGKLKGLKMCLFEFLFANKILFIIKFAVGNYPPPRPHPTPPRPHPTPPRTHPAPPHVTTLRPHPRKIGLSVSLF